MMPMPTLRESQLVSTDPKTLPLQGAALRCDARGGVARVVFEQRFGNPHAEALHVTYTFALPADAAVVGFRFRVGDKVIEGEIDKKQAARERFEEALLAGQTAALLDEERSSLFTQEIGNVPPGAEVIVEIALDQKLRWLDDANAGAWEWRFPLAAAPRYLGVAGRVNDSGKIALDVASPLPIRASLSLDVGDVVTTNRSPESPTHPLSCIASAHGFHVELGSGNAVPLDRDIAVHWPVGSAKIGVSCAVAGPREGRFVDAHALFTILPPAKLSRTKSVSRDVTFLLDTSGSMGGSPIDQAKRVVLAMLDGLAETDRFEAIEFSNRATRFKNELLFATAANKAEATSWLRNLQASGGTEMRTGILEALRPDATRRRPNASTQVVLVTDGLIGFEQEIIASILALLPGDARLHTVGVGSSVNRSLTGPAARAGRGIEVVIGLGEDPERAASRLRMRSDAPVVVDVEASGSALLQICPVKLPDLFAGAPLLASARVRAEGGEIVLRGKTSEGVWEERVQIAPTTAGTGNDAIVSLFGREAVEDAEMQIAGGADARDTDAAIEALGLAYRISTRLTSWVAIATSPSIDPREPTRRQVMPQALPHGMAVEALGLRSAPPPMMRPRMAMAAMGVPPALSSGAGAYPPRSMAPAASRRSAPVPAPQAPRAEPQNIVSRIKDALFGSDRPSPAPESSIADDALLESDAEPITERRTAFGRIVLRKSGGVLIEVTTDADWQWEPSAFSLVFDDSGVAPATFDRPLSTRSGLIPAGSTIRISLRFAPTFDASILAAIEVQLSTGLLLIRIGA